MMKRIVANRVAGLLAGTMMAAGPAPAAEEVFDNMIPRSAAEGGFRIFAEGKTASIVLNE